MKSAIEVSLESRKMEKSVKKREKKHARAKRQAERQAKGERARRERERQQARRRKQQARKLRNLANNLKRKEEVQRARQEASLDPSQSAESKKEEPEREKPKKARSNYRNLVNSEVRKVLLRAPFKANEKSRNISVARAEKKDESKPGWKAGMRKVEAAVAPARKSNKLSSTRVLKLLKEAMDLYRSDQQSATLGKTEVNQGGVPLKDIGPDYSADVPDLSNMAGEGTCGHIVGLTPHSSDGKEVQKGEEEYRIQNTEYRNTTSTTQIQKGGEECRKQITEYRNATTHVQKGGGEAEPTTQSSDGLTASSDSEAESSDGGDKERRHSSKRISKKYVKRPAKSSHRPAESSDEEKEEVEKRKAKRFVKQSRSRSYYFGYPLTESKSQEGSKQNGIPGIYLTESSDNEERPDKKTQVEEKIKKRKAKRLVKQDSSQDKKMPNLTSNSSSESSHEKDQKSKVKILGTMRGGARKSCQEPLSYADELRLAIQKAQERLKLDVPTLGDGNCCSYALVQQCQRPPVRLFLQSRGVTINNFMQLKENVAQFIQTNSNTPKVQNMRINFELSQMNIHREGLGLRKRSWRQYWTDMQRDARDWEELGRHWSEFWADDIWLQAASWYLNMDVHIIWAGDNTQGRIFSDIDGNFASVPGVERPLLYLGYIVNEHYQSLLPLLEDQRTPEYLAPPAVDKALKNALEALEVRLANGSQVSFWEN